MTKTQNVLGRIASIFGVLAPVLLFKDALGPDFPAGATAATNQEQAAYGQRDERGGFGN